MHNLSQNQLLFSYFGFSFCIKPKRLTYPDQFSKKLIPLWLVADLRQWQHHKNAHHINLFSKFYAQTLLYVKIYSANIIKNTSTYAIICPYHNLKSRIQNFKNSFQTLPLWDSFSPNGLKVHAVMVCTKYWLKGPTSLWVHKHFLRASPPVDAKLALQKLFIAHYSVKKVNDSATLVGAILAQSQNQGIGLNSSHFLIQNQVTWIRWVVTCSSNNR